MVINLQVIHQYGLQYQIIVILIKVALCFNLPFWHEINSHASTTDTVLLKISDNDQHWSNGVMINYTDLVEISSYSPVNHGNFINSTSSDSDIQCRFYDTETPSSSLTNHIWLIKIDATNDGKYFTNNQLLYYYDKAATIDRFYPYTDTVQIVLWKLE